VQVCESGCKGIWFDQSELKGLDQAGQGMGSALEAALQSPRVNTPPRAPLMCPRCHIQMQLHKFQRDKEVNVDECYSCGGFFLDPGELKEIRDHYMNDAERAAYADQVINAAPGFSAAEHELDKETRMAAVGNLTEKILGHFYWRQDF
jgi:Zn-finger nucleic acid-binding protein